MTNGETPAPSEHPAKKLMQYPIDSNSEGIPASVIRNPELARILAESEDEYRNKLPQAWDNAEYYKTLTESSKAAQKLIGEYYREHHTTKRDVKKAQQHNDPAWLDPAYASEHAAQILQEKREKQYQESRATLRELRDVMHDTTVHPKTAASEDELQTTAFRFSSHISASNHYRTEDQMAIIHDVTYGARLLGYDLSFNPEMVKKIYLTEKMVYQAARKQFDQVRTGSKPETKIKKAFEALSMEASQLLQKVNGSIRDGSLTPEAGYQVFQSFNLALYSTDDYDEIKTKINESGTNVSALLSELYNTDEKIQYIQEAKNKLQIQRDEATRRSREIYEQDRLRRKERQAEQRAQEKATMDAFMHDNPQLLQGREPFKRKVAQQYPEVADAIKYLDVSKEYRAEFNSIESLGAAMTAFTINASEQVDISPGAAIALPIGKTDIDVLWRNTFNRPKNYYGGQAGKSRIVIHRAREEDVKGFRTKYDLQLDDSLFAVEMTIESVKNGKVHMESTLYGVLRPVADSKLPIEKYAFLPLKSTYVADQEHLDREQQASIQVARAAEAASILRTISGTQPPSRR